MGHVHHPRYFRTVLQANADVSAMLMLVERGFDFAGPAAEIAEPEAEDDGWTYECEWCGHVSDEPHDHYGANLCESCVDEVNARHDAAEFRDDD